MQLFAARLGKLSLPCALLIILSGCAGQKVLLCGGRVHNSSSRNLEEIRIEHQPTGQMLTANHIPAGGDVELAFIDRELKATGAALNWQDSRLGPRQETLDLPRKGEGDGPQQLVYDLDGAGQVAVRLIPCP